MKLTVSEYATEFKTSVQSVYQRIKRGSLKSVTENGIKYVLIEEDTTKPNLKPELESGCKDLLKLVKSQQKEIKRLTKELSKAQFHSMATMKGYIDKLETLQLEAPRKQKDEDITEAEFEESQEKSGKSKKKKKKKGKK